MMPLMDHFSQQQYRRAHNSTNVSQTINMIAHIKDTRVIVVKITLPKEATEKEQTTNDLVNFWSNSTIKYTIIQHKLGTTTSFFCWLKYKLNYCFVNNK
jgi:hypothetical protein